MKQYTLFLFFLILTVNIFLESSTLAKNLQQAPYFSQIKDKICKGVENYPIRDPGPCTEKDFQIVSFDLNADGQSEWFYSSPICGALGNCNFYIFQRRGGGWALVGNAAAQFVWPSQMNHKGYKDINISQHDSACVSYRSTLVWNGEVYKHGHSVACNFCNEDGSEKKSGQLPKGCVIEWEKTNFLFAQ